jgi:hypothetical protein
VSEQLYDEYGDPVDVEYVDENGMSTEDRLLALEAAFAGAQAAGGYEDEDESYDDGLIDEEEWLDELVGDLVVLQEQLGRDLTQEELDTLAAFAEATGMPPTEAYGTVTPHIDLNDETDRVNYAAQVLDQEEERQQRQDDQRKASLTDAEAAAHVLAEGADYGGEGYAEGIED